MSDTKKVYSQGKIDPKHPLITQSFLNMFQRCPLSAKFRYIDNIVVRPGIAALQGTSTDAAVTYGAEQMIKSGHDAPLSQKVDLALTTFHEKLKEHTVEKDDDVKALAKQTGDLVTAHHQVVAPTLKPVATQEAILVKGPEFDMAGTIDLVEENDILADTKTAGNSGQYPEKGLVQSALYYKLYKEHHGRAPSAFRFDVIVKNKTPKVERVEVKNVAHSYLDYVITSTLTELNNSLKSGFFRIAEPGHNFCKSEGKYCGYFHLCPKGKK